MSYMTIWNPSDSEKENILKQHQTQYDGYATLNTTNNLTPLTVQDFAKDKLGMTVGNNGKVQGFSNMGINEQMYGQRLDVTQDLDPKAGFDYVEGSSNDIDTFEGMHKKLYKEYEMEEQYDEMESAYDFGTGGPEEFNSKTDFDTINQEYENQQNVLDYESQHDTDSDAREMVVRMNKMMNKEYDGQEMMGGEDNAYNFVSDGPGDGDIYEEDEMLDESTVEHKEVILEMFKRMSKF